MPLIQVNAATATAPSFEHVAPALAGLSHGQCVTIMTHGLRFSPFVPEKDPHTHILSLTPRACWKAVSWPRHLHLDRESAGLGIAFGWHAVGPLRQVATRAFAAGDALADLIAYIHQRRPDLCLNLIAHSLGARVVLRALSQAPAASVARVILMSGAEYRSVADAAMDSAAGHSVQVLNVYSHENAVFDGLFRAAVPAPKLTDWTLSGGLRRRVGWCDLRADCSRTRDLLHLYSVRTRAPVTRVCHWSTYLRPGLFRLYRRVLDPNEPELLPRLAAELADTRSKPPRWHLPDPHGPHHAGA